MKILVFFDLHRAPLPDETFSARELREDEGKPTEADVLQCLKRLGHEVDTLAVFDNVLATVEKIKSFQPDVVFNLTESFHATRAHEPNVSALLELLKVRYTGAGPDALLLCKDKSLAKKLLAYHHVRVARFVVSHRARPLRGLKRFVYPAFVKPINQESSDGISQASFARDEGEVLERVKFLHEKFSDDVLIEEYIEGRELYLSVLGNKRLTVFPARELFFGEVPADVPKFATSKAKWDDAYRKKWGIKNGAPAPLPDGVAAKLEQVARKVYRVLKIRGLGRIDVRLTAANEIIVIEANPNPSLAKEDDFAQSAIAAGMDYDALIQKILDNAAA
ncbi:MAG TPA: ATP-grasp domain-containing protein [Polyangia bacterium]|nr:ATP-grasp domain-containing protein [Polyangia bacterium]